MLLHVITCYYIEILYYCVLLYIIIRYFSNLGLGPLSSASEESLADADVDEIMHRQSGVRKGGV